MLDYEDTPEAREEYSRKYEDYLRQGWNPHIATRSFVCGWCGHSVSSQIGISKHETSYPTIGSLSSPRVFSRDIRICVGCSLATTFIDKEQFPKPLLGERFRPAKKDPDLSQIVALYDEACIALSQGGPSCAVLVFRKILMHIAVEQGATKGQTFVGYVEHLKDANVVGKPQHALLERIRKAGNSENHEIRRASVDEARDLLDLTSLLVRSVYFAA